MCIAYRAYLRVSTIGLFPAPLSVTLRVGTTGTPLGRQFKGFPVVRGFNPLQLLHRAGARGLALPIFRDPYQEVNIQGPLRDPQPGPAASTVVNCGPSVDPYNPLHRLSAESLYGGCVLGLVLA